MTNEEQPEQSIASLNALIAHTRWVADYLSTANNNLMLRASTLLGLLGVETAFVAGWKPSDFSKFHAYKYYLTAGVVSALIAAFLLVLSVRVKNFVYSNFSQIQIALQYEPRRATQEIIDILLHKQVDPNMGAIDRFLTRSSEKAKRDMFDRLLNENTHITKLFKYGTYFTLCSQLTFGVLLIMKWINN